MKVQKSRALTLAVALVGLGLLIEGAAGEDGNGALGGCCCCCCCCCFFAAVRFLADDGIFAGDVAVKNSCVGAVESENARDTTRKLKWTRGSWGLKTRNGRVNSEWVRR